jgi:AcrR family transcriptional regulator
MKDPAEAPTDVRQALLAAARVELVERGQAGISLRAVARRAGVSHAAPKYYFSDRAALLTAVATRGFAELAAALREVPQALAAMGHAYIAFALANPALFDLMFRPGELHAGDEDLRRAQQEAIGVLDATAGTPAEDLRTAPAELTMISWALAHGLAVLARDGALAPAGRDTQPDSAELARHLVDVFAQRVAREHTQP